MRTLVSHELSDDEGYVVDQIRARGGIVTEQDVLRIAVGLLAKQVGVDCRKGEFDVPFRNSMKRLLKK